MDKKIDEFINSDGSLIHSKMPPVVDPKTSAKTTTDKSVRMRAQPFLYTVYRRFFSEQELPYTKQADEMAKTPEKFHKFLESEGLGNEFEKYFQKTDSVKGKLKEVSRIKAYELMEMILDNRPNSVDLLPKGELPTIEEIRGKETLLVDKLTKLAEAVKNVMSESEKKVLLNYFAQKIKHG